MSPQKASVYLPGPSKHAVFFHCTQKNRQIISVVDPYSLNATTVSVFQVNPDQGFWWPKIGKIQLEKTYFSFIEHCNLLIPILYIITVLGYDWRIQNWFEKLKSQNSQIIKDYLHFINVLLVVYFMMQCDPKYSPVCTQILEECEF